MTADRSYHGGAGEAFAARANAPGLNSLHERPAVLELIGDVDGQRIADLGCGAGNYLVELAQRGAQVTGVDGSQALVAHASSAAGGARVIHHILRSHWHSSMTTRRTACFALWSCIISVTAVNF